jgi:hypothetical protein
VLRRSAHCESIHVSSLSAKTCASESSCKRPKLCQNAHTCLYIHVCIHTCISMNIYRHAYTRTHLHTFVYAKQVVRQPKWEHQCNTRQRDSVLRACLHVPCWGGTPRACMIQPRDGPRLSARLTATSPLRHRLGARTAHHRKRRRPKLSGQALIIMATHMYTVVTLLKTHVSEKENRLKTRPIVKSDRNTWKT